MFDDFKKFISDNNLINTGESILLAVSGGIDSMAMSHLFLRLDTEIAIIHCNFQLRANESDKDEEMVKTYAEKQNIPFFSKRFETNSFASDNGISIQMAARELRYIWFEEIRTEHSYDKIAVAHNLNDNIETLLINLIRGTGIAGLTGIRPAFNRIIRPLLFAKRQDIVDYCRQYRIIFREDQSNAETKYIRNKIRHLIIPILKEINPSVEYTLADTAERFIGINEIVTDYIAEIRESISTREGKVIKYDINPLTEYLQNSTILFEMFRPYGITNVQIKDLRKVIEGKTGGQILTDTHRIIKNRSELLISSDDKLKEIFYTIENINELRNLPEITSAEYVNVTSSFKITSDPFIAYLDSDKISFPLIMRKWKAGDHFYPLGMKQKKKLSDYFIDNKYSKIVKEKRFILESDGNIIWIVGDRIDNRYRITSSTRKALIIRAEGAGYEAPQI